MIRRFSPIALLLLPLAAFVFSAAFVSAPQKAYACYCEPNLAVFPDGNDPSCVNHNYVGNDPTSYCTGGGTPISGTTGGTTVTPAVGSPSVTFSCNPSVIKDFKSLIENFFVGCFLTPLIYVIMGLAFVVFLWGAFTFIRAEGDERKKAKNLIIYGIVGLFVMVAFWGLVNFVGSTFRLNTNDINQKQVTLPTS
ncbi:MAG: hypothetical protein KGH93_02495 [Patescibacteria group bacterium]|nr:hypothetical protein [Patescibacteria group bacterium]MDE1946044.1 hypothetical protein [Patescibacteria group bacterium]